MRGVLLKVLRETWSTTALFALALFLVETLLNLILPGLVRQLGDLLQRLPFVREFIGALLGIDLQGELTAQLMQAFVWVHPVVLALVWAYAMISCTRFPAGEVERGTVDILLSLPVSRRGIYLCETAGWMTGGFVLMAAAAAGYAAGSVNLPDEVRPPIVGVLLVLANLYGVYLAVAGLCCLFSSLADRRGRAVGPAFVAVLASFLLTFLGRFWAPAEPYAFLSVLSYYQPADILGASAIDPVHLAVLLVSGGAMWLAGMEITARRSICTT